MTFTEAQQKAARKEFIEECRQKAWGASCNASFIEASLNELIAKYQQMQKEDRQIEADIKSNAEGFNGHTVENRNKRAEMQKNRSNIANAMKLVAKNIQEGSVTMQRLLDTVDNNLSLAKHAATWEWSEVAEPNGPSIEKGVIIED